MKAFSKSKYIILLIWDIYHTILVYILFRKVILNIMDKNFEKYNDTAELLKVLAHPVRICIINGLMEKGECNVTYMQECLEIPQSTLSQHLQKLRSAKLIEGKRSGLEIKYSICDERIKEIIKVIIEK